MNPTADHLATPENRGNLASRYRNALLDDVLPFWLQHGLDPEHGGILTALDRDGTVLDTDKSVWFQGRAAWTFATLFNTVERRAEWLDAARSCIEFSRRHCFAPDGKMYFTVTREGRPLRMRRYVYSESFAAIANAAFAKATGDARAADDAVRTFATDLRGLPVPVYWHDMKFWWPHNEAVIATLLAWKLTGERRFAEMHRQAHDWSFTHFPDPEHGEWYGYLHRDGSISSRVKGSMWKGPFHLPRMLGYCARLLDEAPPPAAVP